MTLRVPEWFAWVVLMVLGLHSLVAQVQLWLLWRDMRWMRAQLSAWGFLGPGDRVRNNPWPPKSSSSH